jgi:hypothetical protein
MSILLSSYVYTYAFLFVFDFSVLGLVRGRIYIYSWFCCSAYLQRVG